MKKTTRLTAILLVLVMLMQTLSFAVQLSDFSDFPKDTWSTEAMTAAVDNGLLIGMGNNKIEPKRLLTRAEMAAIVTRAFGATVEKDISFFDDVNTDDWYSSVVAKAYNMQVMQGTSDTTFAPKNNISREEVFLSLARVLHIDSEDYEVLDKFSDNSDIAEWSKNAVTGMVGVKYLNGYEDGTLRPKGKITREELAQVFHNIFKTYISEPGTYSTVAPEGSVIIRAPGVTLQNVTINGDLILADGIGAGNCDIKNVTVNGRIIVRGGEGTVDFVNVKSTGNVIINDVNGTVNFHNYRTDAPFVNNLVELTPATFLQKQAGGGTGGKTFFDVVFHDKDGNPIGQPQSIALGGTATAPATNPEPNDPEKEYFLGWSVDGSTVVDVSTYKINKKTTFVPVFADKTVVKFTDENGNPIDTSTQYIIPGECATSAVYPEITDETKYVSGWTTDGTTAFDFENTPIGEEDVTFSPILSPRYIVKFNYVDTNSAPNTTSTNAYAIPGEVLESDRILTAGNFVYNGYAYTFANYWTLSASDTDADGVNDSGEVFDFANTKIIPPAQYVFNAVYTKEPVDVLVKFIYDIDNDGIIEDTATEDTNSDAMVDDTDKYPDEYAMDNVHTDEFITAPANPEITADHAYSYTFRYWTLDKEKSGAFEADDGGNLVGAGADMDIASYTVNHEDVDENNVLKIYAVFEKTAVPYTVTFTVDDKDDFREKDADKFVQWTDNEEKTVYGGVVSLPAADSVGVPVRNGTTFKYWYTKNDDGSIKTKYENVASIKIEPEVTKEKPLPETETVLYAYMECKVNFIDEVNDAVGPRNATIYVQYNTPIDGEKEYSAGVYNKDILAWTRVEKGFERTDEMSEDYAVLYPGGYVHEIPHSWFEKDYEGKWVETAENSGEWTWSSLEEKDAKLVDFDETAAITTDMNVYLSTRRIDATASFASDRLPNIGVVASVPYEKETRFLDAFKDALFLNEGYVTAAVDESGVEDKLFDKLRKQSVIAPDSKEILNVNKTVLFVSVLGEENLNKFIDEQLKKYFESDEAAQTLEEFLTKYLTNVNASNEKEVAAKLGELVNKMLENDATGTIATLEKAAHNIAENDLTALSDVIKAYVDSSLETEAGTTELKTLLDEAFIKYCNEHEDDFRDFLETIVEDLLIVHPDPSMIDLVTVLAIDKVKAGQFKAEIKAEIEKMADEDLQALIVNFVENDFAFVESGISAALDDENFVISMVELLADDGTFKTTIKTLAEQTLTTGGDDLKNKLEEMFLNDLTEDQKKNLIDNYVTNLEDPAKIRELAITHIGKISNAEILSYVQGENPLIDIEASKLLTYINLYQDQIPNSTILAKVKEENSPIKVPSDTLLSLVKNGTISIPEATVLALVKTELISMTDAQIATYIADGTIPVADSFIAGIITDAINAERNSLIADAKNQAYDEIYEELILNGIPQDIAEEEAAQKVEEKAAEIEAKVDEEIAKKIADETTPAKIAEAKANITEEQVADYRTDIDSQINSIEYSAIESYANNYIQNKLTAQDIENNYATLVAQLDEATFATMKANVLSALDKNTVEANKAAFLSLVTADIVGNIKLTIINDATDAEILKIKASIADILKEDDGIQQAVIDAYLDEAFASDDLGDNLDTLLADNAGRHLIAVVVDDYVESDPDAKNTLVTEVIKTLKSDIAANGTMIDTAIGAYLSDPDRKAELITKAVNMLSTKDSNDKYILDDKNSLVYKEIYDAVQAIITDANRCAPIIDAYVGSVIDVDVEAGEEVDFVEIIDIFCEGKKEFRDGVIDRFIENLNTLPDKDGDGIGDGVEIVEEMIDAILEKMGKAGHVDEEIILVVLDYIVQHHEDDHGKELIHMLVTTITSMDNILEFAKELGYDAVNENLAEVDKFKKQVSTQKQFEVNANNVFIMGPLRELMVSLEFDNLVEKYLKPRLPQKVLNELPLDIAKPIYERSRQNYLDQLDAAIAKAENGEVGYVNSGVTFHFNPVHEIYVEIYKYALEEYEKACGFVDDNTGKPGDFYDKYVKENPYIDDLIELLAPEKLFDEVSTNHDYTEVGSGYAVRKFIDYYDIVKTAAVLLDDSFLWYLEHVDYADIEDVLRRHEERVLGYTNLLVSLANSYAVDGIPDDIEDIYNDILADALASGDFEKIVGKVENITNKDVEYYIDKVLENRYPELVYDKVLDKAGARVATILDLYIDSKFNRFVDGDDYDKVVEWLEFAYEDQNANITVDYVFDKIMDEDNTKDVEFRGNTAEITRRIAPTLSDN